MKKNFLYSIILLVGLSFQTIQAQRNCGTMEHRYYVEQKDPRVLKNMAKAESRLNSWIKDHNDAEGAEALYDIPVVVHVIYNSAIQNISDAQIMSQMDVLNEDFGFTNSDTSLIPAAFRPDVGNPDISFCLATRDPFGNPSSGITRTQTNINAFGGDDAMKFSASGGDDAWPNTDYLNVWVCPLGGGLLGYATFPGMGASIDGVVIGYNYFGTVEAVSPPFNKGRTTTHEVGHWLSLYHIWGDDGGSCNGSDQVADTPNQGNASSGCPTFPRTDACSPSSPGYMFMNYMDYTNDACMNSFSNGQISRMHGTLNTSRSSLASSDKCDPLVLQSEDALIEDILSPVGTFCSTEFTAEFMLTNWGANTLTSVTINYVVDGGAIQTQPWTGSLPSLSSVNIFLPATTVPAGSHNLEIYTSNPNNTTDGDPSNDSHTSSFTTTSQQPGSQAQIIEGFENLPYPAGGWSVNNPDNNLTFSRTSQASKDGTWSIWVNNYDYAANGEIEELLLPTLDLTAFADPMLTFDVAYALYSASGYSEILEVEISTDCGVNFTSLYNKSGQALTTSTPYFMTNPFVPGANDWRNEAIDLSSYVAFNSVLIKFKHTNDYENNMYIDNINLQNSVALDPLKDAANVRVYPNPAGNKVFVEFELSEQITNGKISLLNVLGESVSTVKIDNTLKGKYELDLSQVPAGMYFVKLGNEKGSVVKKLVRN